MLTIHHQLFNPNSSLRIHAERLLLLGILLLAFVLRVYAIDASSLWSDEGNTWALLARSYPQIARDAAADIHPPGYYWLLKSWSTVVGRSAAAMRLFSAFAGTLLVLFVYRIGHLIARKFLHTASPYGLLAALLAALSPFQIFYSQEARMYMLLALAGTMLMLAFLQIAHHLSVETVRQPADIARNPLRTLPAYLLYFVSGVIGLWTHYSFPILLAVAGGAFLIRLVTKRIFFLRFVLINLLVLLCYLPWLPTAIARVQNWPKGGEAVALTDGIEMLLRTVAIGPLRNRLGQSLEISPGWLIAGGVLPIVGCCALYWIERQRNQRHQGLITITLLLWLFLPISVMLAFGLFTDAFLKFLLVAAPAWSLAVAAISLLGRRIIGGVPALLLVPLLALGMAIFSWNVLPNYYGNPLTRDNYAGVARYVDIVSKSDDSLVLLNAPGQQEVWHYYRSNSALSRPLLALPAQRPIDEQATIALMARELPKFEQIFALFWATDESDPNRVIEGWLDQHAFKSIDSWQGNLRFVRYDFPINLACDALDPATTFGPNIALRQSCFVSDAGAKTAPSNPLQIGAGETLLMGLRWQTNARLDQRYKATIQLLDARNQVVAQRDSEPGGGSLPTDGWQPNSLIADNYGIMIPFGTPPGSYRLIAALYDAETGVRLPTEMGDHVQLRSIDIVRPKQKMPVEIVPMGIRLHRSMGAVNLVGYDLYRKGFAHAPQTPINIGDLVHVTLYWQAPQPLPAEWPADLHFTMTLGDQVITAPLVGGAYPTSLWAAGEFVRGEFDILYTGTAKQVEVRIDNDVVTLEVAVQ